MRRYIEKRSGTDPEKRWSEFAKLACPRARLPSEIATEFHEMIKYLDQKPRTI